MSSVNFSLRSLIVITGASKGIGRTIAIETANRASNDSVFILIARSESGLNETNAILKNINSSLTVDTVAADLSEPNIEFYKQIFSKYATETFQNALIFHNAGSLGTVDETTTYTCLTTWTKFFNLNLFSASLLNSVFLKYSNTNAKTSYVINISSLCGSQPFKNMGMYGSGKAARDLFFKVLAEEEKNVFVLNYSPGPVDTDMQTEVRQNLKDQELKKAFQDMVDNKSILSTAMTVNKLMTILESGNYKSGVLIDYFER